MVLGFMLFVGIFEFLGFGFWAKLALSLLLDLALWAFLLREDIKRVYVRSRRMRRRESEMLIKRANQRRIIREQGTIPCRSYPTYYI